MRDRAHTKVLFLDTGPWFGGAQRSLLTLATGLQDAGYDPVVLAADVSAGGLLAGCDAAQVLHQYLPVGHWGCDLRGLVGYVLDWRRTRPILRRLWATQRPDIVHANSTRAALLVPLWRRRSQPLVVHVRDSREPNLVRRWVARRADAVVTISAGLARTWAAAARRLEVIPNGFDLGRLAQVVPTPDWPWAAASFSVIQVADLVAWKRHDLFLQAVALVARTCPGVRAVVVGRPVPPEGTRLLAELRQLAATLGVADRVCFVTGTNDALPWLAAADVVVSTAEREPFGRTVVEALALRKPVVAARGGGPEEILEGCAAGRITAPTAAAVAAAIIDLSDADLRRSLAPAATERAGAYAQTRMVARVSALYQELLAPAPDRDRL